MDRRRPLRSNLIPFRIPARTDAPPELPPAKGGVVVKFPVRELDEYGIALELHHALEEGRRPRLTAAGRKVVAAEWMGYDGTLNLWKIALVLMENQSLAAGRS